MVEFEGVCNFERADNGLVPVRVDTWGNFVFVNLDGKAGPLQQFLGKVPELVAPLRLAENFHVKDGFARVEHPAAIRLLDDSRSPRIRSAQLAAF